MQSPNPSLFPTPDIPHFPQSTVEGHSGRIVAGQLGGVPVIVMQGRVHFYEGYTPAQVTFPMRVLGALGCGQSILTNAAGGIQARLPHRPVGRALRSHQLHGLEPSHRPQRAALRLHSRGWPALLRHDGSLFETSSRPGQRGRGSARASIWSKASISPRPGPASKLLRKSARSEPWAPRWSACPLFRRRSSRGTWASRCSAFPASPISRQAWARKAQPHRSV